MNPRALTDLAGGGDAAAVLFDDAVDDGHADPRSLVEERFEGLEETGSFFLAHAAPRIAERQMIRLALEPAGDPQFTATRHGLESVAGQVPEDLAELIGIGPDDRRVGDRIHDDVVIVAHILAVLEQFHAFGDERRDVDLGQATLPGAGQLQERFDGAVEAPAFLEDDLEQFVRRRIVLRRAGQELHRA